MKREIKLKDLTKEQWDNWVENNCNLKMDCENCPIYRGNCDSSENEICWINNKDIYSDKFLDQEVEIEIENEELLSKEEKEYLSNIIKPFRHRVISIDKIGYNGLYFISIKIQSRFTLNKIDHIDLPLFNTDMYKGIESNKPYTLKDLGLFQENTKITLTEFWNSKEKLAIHCDTEEKATLEKYYNMLEVEKQKENSINELPELFNDLQKLLIEKWDEFDINYRDRLISEYKTLGHTEFYKNHSYACYDKMYESDEQIHENNVKASKEVILDLINRVSFITGEIKDYSQLRLNRDNNGWLILNGNVIGNKGTAKVESIYAGGYNIQRLHIRVLVNKVNA